MLKYFFNRHSLVSRLIWLNILAVISVSILIGFWTRYTVLQDSYTLGIERQQVLNKRISTSIDDELFHRKKRLKQLASEIYSAEKLKPLPEIQEIIDNKHWLHDAFKGGLIVVGIDGYVVLDSPILDQRIGVFLGDREHFLWAKEQKTPYISKPIFGRAVKEPVYIISSPILDSNNNFLGTVTGVTKLKDDAILQKVSEGYLGKSSHVYVLDIENQLIVTSSKKELGMQPLSKLDESGVIQKIINGDFFGLSKSQFGGDVIYSASFLKQTGWIVVNTHVSSDWIAPASILIKEILWISSISMLIIVLFSVYYLRRQLLPLYATTKLINEMSVPGVKAKPILNYYKDEIGDLITAFNGLISQLQLNEAELIKASEQAKAANLVKTQFLSNISHEIKTPLNAVLTLTHIQLEYTFEQEDRLRLQKIQRSGHALLAIMNDIFTFIELENNNVNSVITSFNLEESLSNLIQEHAELNIEKPLEFFFEIERSIPLNLQGDSHHLFKVLGHLLSNAAKFTTHGHVFIQVALMNTLDNTADNQLVLQFCVADTGQGISEEKLGELFEAFKQLDESNSRAYGGIGMGLAISNKLIQLMDGGHISVESQLGKGSRFCFAVPLMLDSQQKTLNNQPINWDNSNLSCALVIDDQALCHSVLGNILADWSITSDSANSLEVALQKIGNVLENTAGGLENQKNYTLIFLDWSLPNTKGTKAIKKIEALYTAAKIAAPPIFIMASMSEAESIEFINETAYPIINKPINRSLIFNVINQEIYGKKLNQASRPNTTTARILIVDDNYVNREIVATLLKKYQLKYDMAKNGLEAIEYTNQHNYDLIFMDLQMPKMDGYEATQEIRKFNSNIPIIALTATTLENDKSRALEVGMNAFLSKPIEPNLFYGELLRHIDIIESTQVIQTIQPIQPMFNKKDKQAKQRILIVDDEVANLKILANTLNKDYLVQIANQGQRALELCNSATPPDLVLLDIQMPNMDGYEVCRLLKDNPNTSRIPIIFVTALSTPQSEEKGLNLGAVDYITKPYQMPVVQARIRTHINLKQKTDLLEKLSYIDGLTQIANRRHFDITLDNEIGRLQRAGQSLGLIMIDIDYFKPYNDNYGHGKGDECLQQVAKALSSEIIRPSDLLARYGGEEFVVILPDTDAMGVSAVAEKLRSTINNLNLLHEHSGIANHITISLGCLAQKITRTTHANILLKEVDDALYEAKKRGRNQVVLAS